MEKKKKAKPGYVLEPAKDFLSHLSCSNLPRGWDSAVLFHPFPGGIHFCCLMPVGLVPSTSVQQGSVAENEANKGTNSHFLWEHLGPLGSHHWASPHPCFLTREPQF